MRVLDLPALRAAGDVVAATIESADLDGSTVSVVTVRESRGHPALRRWYADEAAALAYAAEMADRHGLLLIDLRDWCEPQ